MTATAACHFRYDARRPFHVPGCTQAALQATGEGALPRGQGGGAGGGMVVQAWAAGCPTALAVGNATLPSRQHT